jgi:alpha-amylase
MLFQKKFSLICLLLLLFQQAGYSQAKSLNPSMHSSSRVKGEIIYHIFERSFYDSNGDMNGDFNGLREKLGYLQELGVTSLLLTPIFSSVYYHNYFSNDFMKIDPTYGTLQDWIALVKAVHARGMKIYLDMETQYVTQDHIWFKSSLGNLKSPYSDYILYSDSAHTKPEPIIYGLTSLTGYNGVTRKVATVNLLNPKVLEYNYHLFKYWMDPNDDGKFDDGVDGFRLDHMMDDLDDKSQLTDLFQKFWCPLLTKLREVNPKIKVVAEQANWASFGQEYFKKACIDRVFAFRLAFAIRSLNKADIISMADSTFYYTPAGKQQVVFIENHDMSRFASVVDENPGKLRIGAALNLFIGGIPSIYYGQELGMNSGKGLGPEVKTDGRDIPQREAFEWYKADTGRGMAIWYKNTGPWWDSTNLKPDDGISLQEEQPDPNSLWNFYRKIIHLRQDNLPLIRGKFINIENNNDHVISFLRYTKNESALVVINLSDEEQPTTINFSKAPVKINHVNGQFINICGNGWLALEQYAGTILLPAYGIQVWLIKN